MSTHLLNVMSKNECQSMTADREPTHGGSGLGATPCPAPRGHETIVDGTTLTMHFDTVRDASAFFDWVIENTNHKQNV